MLAELAELADRTVLDDPEPETIWARATTLFEDSAFSDLRWARLTQWRALMAQFFDIPEVQAAASTFTRLTIVGSDRMSARLFARVAPVVGRFPGRVRRQVRRPRREDAARGSPTE